MTMETAIETDISALNDKQMNDFGTDMSYILKVITKLVDDCITKSEYLELLTRFNGVLQYCKQNKKEVK